MKYFILLLAALLLVGCSDMGNPVASVEHPKLTLDDLHGDLWLSGVLVCTAPDLGTPFFAYVKIGDDTLHGDLMRYREGWRFGCVLPDKPIREIQVIGVWGNSVADTLVLTNHSVPILVFEWIRSSDVDTLTVAGTLAHSALYPYSSLQFFDYGAEVIVRAQWVGTDRFPPEFAYSLRALGVYRDKCNYDGLRLLRACY